MLKAGPSPQCWGSLFGSIMAMLAALFAFSLLSGPVSLAALAALVFAANGLALAYRVIDHKEPLLTAEPDGLRFSSVLGDAGLLEWSQVKALRHVTLGKSWLDYVLIASPKPGAFSGYAKWSPASWLGVYLLPTRLLDGGAAAGRAFVAEVEQARRNQRFDHAISGAKAPDVAVDLAVPATAAMPLRPYQPRVSVPPVAPGAAAAQTRSTTLAKPATAQPLVAQRQSLGTAAVPSAKPRKTGVLLNGKPLEF